MKNLQGKFRELTYSELLQLNGGYGGSSSGGKSSGGYSGTSSGGNSGNNGRKTSVTPVGKPTFVRSDKDTLTTSRKNSDGSETVTTVNRKTGAVISSYTTGIRKVGSNNNSTTGGGSYSTASSGRNSGGYSGTSSASGTGRSEYGYPGTSSGSYSGTSSGSSQPKNTPTTEPTTPGSSSSDFKHQVCADPNQVHCDIIAWNHAVDAGLNPAGKGNEVWDGNKLTVDEILTPLTLTKLVEFNADLAGKKGYIFYDWTGDGTFDHMEYCKIESGGNYNYFSNEGFEQGESLISQNFSRDKNAGALNDGPGRLKFVSLN